MKQKTVTFWGAWLGLHRNPSARDEFYWIDGTPLAGQFSARASGEPNQVQERCCHMYAAWYRIGKWNGKECSFPEAQKSRAPVILCQKRFTWLWGDQDITQWRPLLFCTDMNVTSAWSVIFLLDKPDFILGFIFCAGILIFSLHRIIVY